MKRPHEPIKVELEGLQVICATGVAVSVMIMGRVPRGDDLVVGVLAGMLLTSWLIAILMALFPRVNAVLLRLGWLVRAHVIEAGTRQVTAACLRLFDTAERRGWITWGRRLMSVCMSSAPASAARRWHARVTIGLRRCRERVSSWHLQQQLAAAACKDVVRCKLDEAYSSSSYAPDDASCNGQR